MDMFMAAYLNRTSSVKVDAVLFQFISVSFALSFRIISMKDLRSLCSKNL